MHFSNLIYEIDLEICVWCSSADDSRARDSTRFNAMRALCGVRRCDQKDPVEPDLRRDKLRHLS